MAQASRAAITQNPGTVALKNSPFTTGVSISSDSATARSATRSAGVRRWASV